MQDLVIKGTGNSRFLKSVSSFLTDYPSYEDFAAALVAGTLPIDLNGINSDGITQAGTPYNKSAVLSDATASLFDLTSAATVNDVLSAIGSGGLGGNGGHFAACTYSSVSASKEVTVSEKCSFTSGLRLTVLFTNGNSIDNFNLTLNCRNGSVTAPVRMSANSSYSITFGANTVLDLLYISENSSQYWLVLAQSANTSTASVVSGTYTGTGTYSDSAASGMTSITCYGTVKAGIILAAAQNGDVCLIANNKATTIIAEDGNETLLFKLFGNCSMSYGTDNEGNKTLLLGNAASAERQMNFGSLVYHYALLVSL